MADYYGDVEVTVRYRWRVSAEFEGKKKPTPEQMLKALQDNSYEDIADEEVLEVLSVEKVGKNCARENKD